MKNTIKALAVSAVAGSMLMLGGVAQANQELATSKGCMACHTVDKAVVGPAYKDVAAKYTEADLPALVEKVSKGGAGVWGQIPMPANAHVAKEDIETIVKWVLTLNEGAAAPAPASAVEEVKEQAADAVEAAKDAAKDMMKK